MTAPLENPRWNSSVLPASPPDTLLRNFRATLDTRWGEFDRATMKEAEWRTIMGIGARIWRDSDEKFLQTKSAFDNAKSMLATVKNDTELKASADVLRKVEETIQSLTRYLASIKPEEKSKSHNIILAKTTADLASFRAELTGKDADKREAEVAVAAEKAIPRAALVAWAAATTVPFISSAEAKEFIQEGQKEAKWTLRTWILEAIGFDKKTLIEDMAKQAKGESIWFEKKIKLWIFGLLNKISFLGMMDDWTPEERKLAGIDNKIPNEKETDKKEAVKEAGDTALIRTSFKGFARTYIQPVIDTTGKIKYFSYANIDQIITIEKFKDMAWKDILGIYAKYKSATEKKDIKNDFGIIDKDIDPELVFFVIERMATWKWKTYIEKHALTGQNNETTTVWWIFSRLHKNMHLGSKFDSIKPSKPITGPSDIGEFLWEIGTKIDMPLQDAWSLLKNIDYAGTLNELGIGASMAGYVISNKHQSISQITLDTIKESDVDEPGKEWLKKVLDFWRKFQDTIVTHFSFGNPGKYKEFLSNKPIDIGDVFRLYATTGWDPSYEGMNPSQQAYVYMKLWGILGKDPAFRGEYFNQPLISALFDAESKVHISPEVKNIIGTIFNSAAQSVFEKMGGFITEVWSTLDITQKAIFTAMLGAGIVALWYLRSVKWVGMWISATVIAGGVGLAIAAMWPGQQKIKINNIEYTPNQMKDKMVKEIPGT